MLGSETEAYLFLVGFTNRDELRVNNRNQYLYSFECLFSNHMCWVFGLACCLLLRLCICACGARAPVGCVRASRTLVPARLLLMLNLLESNQSRLSSQTFKISIMSTSSASSGLVIDTTTVLSLLSTLAILATAYLTSLSAIPATSGPKTRFLFTWHAFDALIHFLLEGSYLYNCFFSFGPSSNPLTHSFLAPNTHFLGHENRLYGAAYGSSAFSLLWQEYAKADLRWAGTDLTVISLELLTVFLGGPIAVWICVCLAKGRVGSAWFWMCVLATGELYGGECFFFLSSFLSLSLRC